VPEGESFAIVRSFMAHHQGMTIVAIGNALFDGAMRERFHAEPVVRATELLLQERVPRDVASTRPWAAEVKSAARASEADPSGGRKVSSPHQSIPVDVAALERPLRSDVDGRRLRLQPLGRHGRYAMARGRDPRRQRLLYFSSRHAQRRPVVGRLPADRRGAGQYSVLFNEDRAEFTRRDGSLTTTLDVLVSAEDDAEVRRVTITMRGLELAKSKSPPMPS
jgi:cyclic beta-1,2-glucan synthetase